MRIFRKSVSLAACLALGAALLVGCAQEPAVVLDSQLESRALAVIKPQPELLYAARILVNDCMAEKGFPTEELEPQTQSSHFMTALGVGGLFVSREVAQTLGYPTSVVGNDGDAFEVSREYNEAMNGPPEAKRTEYQIPGGLTVGTGNEGCFAEGVTAVYGSPENYLEIMYIGQVMRSEINLNSFANDSRLKTSLKTYAACMQQAGYPVDSVTKTLELADERFGASRSATEPPSAEEQAMAVDDWNCQTTANIAEISDTIYIEKSAVWLTENEPLVVRWEEMKTSALRAAKAVIEQ